MILVKQVISHHTVYKVFLVCLQVQGKHPAVKRVLINDSR